MSVSIRLTFEEEQMNRAYAVEVAQYLAAEAETHTGEAPWWSVEIDSDEAKRSTVLNVVSDLLYRYDNTDIPFGVQKFTDALRESFDIREKTHG